MESKQKQKILLSVTLSSCLLLTSINVMGASQGVLGNTSSGTLNISVTKPARADITNLSDLTLPTWLIGDGDVKMTEDICVYSTRPNGQYSIQASGSGNGGAFGLSNGPHTLNYSVVWNAGGVNGLNDTGQTLPAGSTVGPLTKASTDSSSCSGSTPGATARLIVQINESAMTQAPHGTYLGVLTLMVTPN